MKTKFLKTETMLYLLIFIFISCNDRRENYESPEINKAIELIKNNKRINAVLDKLHKESGVKFIFCSVITNGKYRRLGFQVMQSKYIKGSPLKINKSVYKIENIQGIDILFASNDNVKMKDHPIEPDEKMEELIRKGFITVNGPESLMCNSSIHFIFCKNDDNIFTEITPEFVYEKEKEAREHNQPYIEDKYYPDCS